MIFHGISSLILCNSRDDSHNIVFTNCSHSTLQHRPRRVATAPQEMVPSMQGQLYQASQTSDIAGFSSECESTLCFENSRPGARQCCVALDV